MQDIKSLLNIDDKRIRQRYNYPKNVICTKIIGYPEGKLKSTMIRLNLIDLSYGGIGTFSNKDLFENDILIFKLPHNGYIKEFTLQVEWTKYDHENRYGLKFINLTKDDVFYIHNIIKLLEESA